jgi:hypothetical protein
MSDLFSEEAVLRLFEFVERSETKIPADYLSEAPGVLFAGEAMLSAAGYIPGSNRPPGWVVRSPGNFTKRVGPYGLQVRQCGNSRSEHWSIERYELWEHKGPEALTFPFGRMPIWARRYQAAMRVAEYCHPTPRPPVAAYWEFARARR